MVGNGKKKVNYGFKSISCLDSAAAKDMAGTGKKKVPDFIQKAPRRKDKVQTIC